MCDRRGAYPFTQPTKHFTIQYAYYYKLHSRNFLSSYIAFEYSSNPTSDRDTPTRWAARSCAGKAVSEGVSAYVILAYRGQLLTRNSTWLGKRRLASSCETAAWMTTSSPCFQFAGVVTRCLSVSCRAAGKGILRKQSRKIVVINK
jgi:hypothetical protein